MQALRYISFKSMPALRLLAAFSAGILVQWYMHLSLACIFTIGAMILMPAAGFYFLPPYKKYKGQWLQGTLMLLLFTVCGALLTYLSNIQHQPLWYGNNYHKGAMLIATIEEPLTAKPNAYKAVAKVSWMQLQQTMQPATGGILIYFKKDSTIFHQIHYGSQIVFSKALQPIQNAGNPGGFDYQRYLLFQGVTSQVFLGANEIRVLPQQDVSSFKKGMQQARAHVIHALQQYIPGKKEQGVAEALLIGYRNDLDKQLVQSYSRTGVVHIIAISGLHLGMIYGMLFWLFKPFKSKRWHHFAFPITVLIVLWLFTIIAGAVPSITRSAVMFSCLVSGELLHRKANIYNTLAVAAFCLLLYNPFYLWDVGFQLSFAAVLSIIIFMKPIYHWLYFDNKILDKIWMLMATTLAAQLLTLPLVLYYFHQFPFLFLITNLLVVPLSSLILFIAILLTAVAALTWTWMPVFIGKLAFWLLWLMNSFIEHIEKLPFSLWQNVQTDGWQTLLLYVFIILVMVWLFNKNHKALLYALFALLLFTTYTSLDIYNTRQQQKLIVYDVPKATAIDIIEGNNSKGLMSASVIQDSLMQSFYLLPTRLMCRAMPEQTNLLTGNNYLLHIRNQTILLIGKALPPATPAQSLRADVVIITNNPPLNMRQLQALADKPLIVFDNSNPQWKIERWKKDCNSLHLPFHSVAQEGAFVMDW